MLCDFTYFSRLPLGRPLPCSPLFYPSGAFPALFPPGSRPLNSCITRLGTLLNEVK